MSTQQTPDNGHIAQDDIIFECPYCSKSMAIDPRGAGRVITCPGCNKPITVPFPRNRNIPSPATPDQMAGALSQTSAQVHRLREQLKDVSARRTYLEQVRSRNINRLEAIRREFDVIQSALDRMVAAMQDLDQDLENGPHS